MRINKNTIFLLISFTMLLSPIFMIPPVYSAEIQEIDDPKSSQMLSGPIRVAIYDDANITKPSYASIAGLTNDYSNIQTALLAAGYEVTPLTTNQIYNHELKNARYDVFIMADHLPKTNITNYVKEYWLGGGALLSMDSALCFICYMGILPPESVDDGIGTYWSYQFSTVQNITTLHPVSRSYQVNDSFTISGSISSATFDWSALQGTSIASEVVKVATRPGSPNDATVVAFDPQSRGGKVVHLPSPRDLEDDAILIDAIEWLCPRPKGRILFDLSHFNGYGVDPWDAPYVGWSTEIYSMMRDYLVSRSYTFDKLYPSALGNFTTNNLAPYDLLIINLPAVNFTASEVTSVTNWINNGGGLLALGDSYSWDGSKNLNYLLSSFDLSLIDDSSTDSLTTSFEHPTEEGCSSLTMAIGGLLNYTGNAFPLWGNSLTDICIAGEEYGNGRVILTSDINLFDNTRILLTDNRQYAINVANWLTSWNADILIYTDDPFSANYYKSPLCQALNSLEMPFYLTFSEEYFNYSLTTGSWELLMINLVNLGFADSVFDNVKDYVDAGGHLLMSSYVVSSGSHPLWATLGFVYASNFPDNDPFYVWDDTHQIFNDPFDYDASLFQPFLFYADDGDLLTVYDNATALAGYTASETDDNAVIVLRNDRRTLYNGFIIDELNGDNNLNGFEDRLELWTNEIAFMWAQVVAEPPGTPGIPGYDVYLISFAIVFSIGVILVLKIRKIRKK